MANLKETNKELSTLESKLKAVELAFKNMESAARQNALSNNDVQGAEKIANSFKGTYNNIKEVLNSIKEFKIELGGIGASETGLDKINDKINGTKKEIDGLIDSADGVKEKLKELKIDTDVILPTTFKFESNFEQQRREAEETARINEEAARRSARVKKEEEKEAARVAREEAKKTAHDVKEFEDELIRIERESARIAQELEKEERRSAREAAQEKIRLKREEEKEAARVAREEAKEAARVAKESKEISKEVFDNIQNILRNINKIVNTVVNSIIKSIRTAVNIIKGLIRGASGIFNSIKTGVSAVIKLFGNLGNRIRQEDKSIKKINKSFTELRSALLLIKGAFEKIFNKDLINRGQQIVSTLYSMQVILGKEQANSVAEWAQSMEYAFGLSASQLISQLNELNGVLYGLGINSKDVGVASENILIIGEHLASLGLAGGDTEVAITKLVSGLKGLTQSVDDLGLSVRDAQMDAFLKKLKAQGGQFKNISTDFSSLNEEARIYIRYAALLDQYTSKYDVTQFVESLRNEANALNLVNQSFQNMLNTIGIGLNRLFASFAAYLIPIINWINELAKALFGLIGIDVNIKSSGISDLSSNIDDLNSGLEETASNLDDISKAAKKAGNNLQSFDKISNITESSSTSNSGLSDLFDYSSLMTSMIDPLNEIARQASKSFADELEEQLLGKLKTIWNRVKKSVIDLTGRSDFNLGFDFNKIKENLNTVKNNIIKTIKSWGLFVIEIGFKVLDDLNIGTILTSFSSLIASASNLARAMTDALTPAFRTFYDVGLRPIIKLMGSKLNDTIDKVIIKLDEWADWFDNNHDLINDFFGDLGSGLPGTIDNIFKKISQAFRAFIGEITLDELVETSGTGWGTFLEILNKFGTIAMAVGDILATLAPDFTEFLKNDALPWFTEKLGELGGWLTEHKQDIVDTIENLGSFAWEGFKLFVDAVARLVDIIVDSKGEAVITFFKTIIGLKIASVFGGIASSIGSMIGSFAAFGQLSKLAGSMSSIASAAGSGGAAIEGAGAAAGVAAGPIIAIVAAIAAVIGVIATLWNTSEDFRNNMAQVGNQIAEAWDRVVGKFSRINEVTGETESVFGKLKDAWITFSKALEPVITILGQVLGPILGMLIEMIGTLGAFVVNIASDALNVITGVVNIIIGILQGLVGLIIGLFTHDFSIVEEAWDRIWGGIKETIGGIALAIMDIVGGLVQEIVDIVNGILNIVINLGGDIIDGFGQGISDAWNGFVKFVTGLWDDFIKSIKNFFGIHSPSTVLAEIGNFLIQGFFNGISETWNSLVGGVIKLFENVLQGIKNVFSGIKDWFGNKFKEAKDAAVGAWDGIKSTFSNIADKAAEGLSGIKDKAKDIFNSVKNSAGDILGGIGKAVSNGWEDLKTGAGNLWDSLTGKKYADGGIVTSPTYGLVGEAGPEAIIPLSSDKRSEAIALWNQTGEALGVSIAAMNNAIAPNTASSIKGNYIGKGFGDTIDINLDADRLADTMYEAVYNALVEFYNQSNINSGQNRDPVININGFGLINGSTLRELASLLAPYLVSNGITFGNSNFSI